MKYSVIVPVYNTFDYVKSIVDWFEAECRQRQSDDIELVLIDDGSSQAIDFEIISNQVKLYRKENGGVSTARNYGIEKARGDFLLFLDSDDSYNNGIFSHLDEAFDKNQALDSVLFSFKKMSDSYVDKASNQQEITSGNQALTKFLSKDIRVHICSMAISRRIIDLNNVRFDESLHFSEDVLFIIEYLAHSQQTYISNRFFYNHVMRTGSAINSLMVEKDITHIDAFHCIEARAKQSAKAEDVNFFVATCYINLLKFLIRNKTADTHVFDAIVNNSHFLYGKITYRLTKYALVVFVLRILFKLDSATKFTLLRRVSMVKK